MFRETSEMSKMSKMEVAVSEVEPNDFDHAERPTRVEGAPQKLGNFAKRSETLEQAVRRASQMVWILDSNKEIEDTYRFLAETARRDYHPANVRAMAVDALLRSNNNRYLPMARELLGILRHDERRADLHLRTQQVRAFAAAPRHRGRRQTFAAAAAAPQRRDPLVGWDLDLDIEPGMQAVLVEQLTRARINELRVEAKRAPTVYEDTQNVHNRTINEAVVAVAASARRDLAEDTRHHVETGPIIAAIQTARAESGLPPLDAAALARARESLDRMQQDRGHYQGGSTIRDVLERLYRHMEGSAHRTQLIVRLGEELQDMHGLCATGHLSRLVNVVQGFDDTPVEFRLRVDVGDEIYATLSKRWGERIADSDDLMDALTASPQSDERIALRRTLLANADEILPELLKSYEGVLDAPAVHAHIQAALRKYVP